LFGEDNSGGSRQQRRRGGIRADAAAYPERNAQAVVQALQEEERRVRADPSTRLVSLDDHAVESRFLRGQRFAQAVRFQENATRQLACLAEDSAARIRVIRNAVQEQERCKLRHQYGQENLRVPVGAIQHVPAQSPTIGPNADMLRQESQAASRGVGGRGIAEIENARFAETSGGNGELRVTPL
jgi:hypothetical protein